ncbi:unnamed protein product [Schistosoma curassoni]|uniref:Transcriptional regulator n=1 Tax=Schistosoma curassoni TaxID=6186 RepID=A0A183JCS3_9TREM|nr:unnamed protein product [Schistosoma curassoni]
MTLNVQRLIHPETLDDLRHTVLQEQHLNPIT